MCVFLSIAFDACMYVFSKLMLVLFLSTSPALHCLPMINALLMALFSHAAALSGRQFFTFFLRFLSCAHREGQTAQRHHLRSVQLTLSLDQVAEGFTATKAVPLVGR